MKSQFHHDIHSPQSVISPVFPVDSFGQSNGTLTPVQLLRLTVHTSVPACRFNLDFVSPIPERLSKPAVRGDALRQSIADSLVPRNPA
jgi:hypothetical protein